MKTMRFFRKRGVLKILETKKEKLKVRAPSVSYTHLDMYKRQVVIGVFMIVLHCFGVGLEVGGFALLMYLLMLLLYFRFVPGDALALLMSPLAFAFNIPGTVPLALGLLRGPVSAISGAFGVVSWYFVKMVDGIAEMKMCIRDSYPGDSGCPGGCLPVFTGYAVLRLPEGNT